MKTLLAFSTFLIASVAYATDLTVASFNVLGTYGLGSEFLDERTNLAADLVEYHDYDIFGTQETRHWNTNAFVKRGKYAVLGVNVKGEVPTMKNSWSNLIYYKKDRFEVLESGHFWISETPEKLSKGWIEKQFRNCNWAKFKDKKSGKEFYFFNTHFGLTAKTRLESAKMFVKKVSEISKGLPFITTGDYNTVAEEKPTLKALLDSKVMFDSWKISKTKPYGPKGTFVCMLYNRPINGSRLVENPTMKLDYIFVSKNIVVKKCAVVSDNIGGAYPSDHMPIDAYITIK